MIVPYCPRCDQFHRAAKCPPSWDLDAAAEMGEARAKERAWAEGREPTAAELDAAAELGATRAVEGDDL